MGTKEYNRDVPFDVLRTGIIINSLILHYHTKYNLDAIALPFQFVQYHLFTVGAFFFFTSGYMSDRVYLKKFQTEPKLMSIYLLKKGCLLISIYLVYITLMRFAHSMHLPDTAYQYIFNHPFFLTVLLTFGCLFLVMPIFLWCLSVSLSAFIVVFIGIFVLNALGIEFVESKGLIRKFILDRQMMNYPLLPSAIIYCFGVFFSRFNKSSFSLFNNKSLLKTCITVLIIYIFIVVTNELTIQNSGIDYILWYKHRYFSPIRESLILAVSIVIFTNVSEGCPTLKNYFENSKLLVMGRASLTAYVFGNIFLNLLTPSNLMLEKIILLISVIYVTFLICKWNFGNETFRRALAIEP